MKTPYSHAQLRILNTILEEGNYTAAAKALNMTQPAVSQAMRKLEKSLNLELFQQRGRHLIPTDFCLQLGSITGQMQELESSLDALIQQGMDLDTGTLRLGLCNALPGMKLVRQFHSIFPNVVVEMQFGNFGQTVERVLERIVDVGILANAPDDNRFIRKRCAEQRLMVIAPLKHPLAQAQNVALADLATYPIIFRSEGSATQRVVNQALNEHGVTLSPSFILSNQQGVYEAVSNGLGIGFAWSTSSNRAQGLAKIPVQELDTLHEESVFCLADSNNRVVDAFFASI